MPITVTAPQGVLTPAGEREILPLLTAAVLAAGNATGNSFLTSIVGGHVVIVPADSVYAGGVNRPLVTVRLDVPDVGLADVASRAAFITAATDAVDAATVDTHRREDTWVTIFNAPAGGWGLGGRAYTGDALVSAATAAG